MIEKNNLDLPHPGDIAEQKATEKKWKRSRNFRKTERIEPEPTALEPETTADEKTYLAPEPENEIPVEEDKSEHELARPDATFRIKPPEEQKVSNKGVAHFKDNVIKIAGGFRLHAGSDQDRRAGVRAETS